RLQYQRHRPKSCSRHVARWRHSSRGVLDGSRKLIKRQILRTSNLKRRAPGRRIGGGTFEERCDVCGGDEIDRIVATAEYERSARAARRLLQEGDPRLEE